MEYQDLKSEKTYLLNIVVVLRFQKALTGLRIRKSAPSFCAGLQIRRSETVRMARDEGYSEPDPRHTLCVCPWG